MARRLAFVLIVALAACAEEEVPAAVHVHTTWSGGKFTIREVAERAHDLGLRGVVLSDSYERAARWGPPPLQGLVHWTRERPSVRRGDLAAWIAEIDSAAKAVPEVAIVPGLELAPVCAWSGAPWADGLRAEGLHVHLLAIGTAPVEAYASLPSRTDGPPHWDSRCAARFALALTAAIAALVLLRGRARWTATAAFLVAAAWFPVRRGMELDGGPPVEAAIDAARRAGLSTSWAHPEALFPAAETDIDGVRVRTRPYPERVLLSPAAAFPSIYGDTHSAAGAGREWDRANLDYCEGRRATPLWGIGEADFDGSLVALDTYQTVFLVDSPGAGGVEGALARGACYAAHAPGGRRVSLSFSVSDAATGAAEGMGGTLRASGAVRARVEARGDAGEATITLVLDGRIRKQHSGPLPLVLDLPVDVPSGRSCLRAVVSRHGGGSAVGNPVFVER
ncbi:MAG: hypothetical protein AAB434_08050 [Planctomycetota bacterium]